MIGEKSGVKLSSWIYDCKRKLRQGKLSADKVAELSKAHITAKASGSAKRNTAGNAADANGTV